MEFEAYDRPFMGLSFRSAKINKYFKYGQFCKSNCSIRVIDCLRYILIIHYQWKAIAPPSISSAYGMVILYTYCGTIDREHK